MFGIRRQDLPWAFVVAVAVAVGSGAAGTVATPLGPVDLVAGLAVPAGILFGGPAVAAVGCGLVTGAAARTTLSWWTALDVLAYGGATLVSAQLWRVLAGTDSLRSVRGWAGCGLVGLVAAATAASALAWGAVVGWQTPFYAVALPEFGVVVRSAVAVGGPVLAAAGLAGWTREKAVPTDTGSVETVAAVGLPGVWFVAATAASLAVDGRPVQILAGGVAIAVLAVTYAPRVPWRRTPTTEVSVES